MVQVSDRLRSNKWLLFALGLTLLLSLLLQMPRILDPNSYQEDFGKFFWMHSYADPELFSVHHFHIPETVRQIEIGSLSLIVDTTSPAYSLLFYLTSPFFPIILFHKLLLFPLMMISVYFLYRIGEKIRGPGTGFALALAFAVLNLNAPSSISLASGLQRSFVAPVLIILIYSLMQEKYLLAAFVIFIGGLFYPPVMLLGIITYGLSVLEPAGNRWRFKINWRKALPLATLLGLALIFLLPAIFRQLGRTELPSFEQVDQIGSFLSDPQYLPGGRYPLFLEQSLVFLVGRAGLITRVETFWQTVSLALFALALLVLRPQSWFETPAVLKRLLAASFIAFGLAWLAALATSSFALYLPSRYGRVSLALVLLIFVVTNFEPGIATFVSRFRRLNGAYRFLVILAIGISFLVVIFVIGEGSLQLLSSLRPSVLKWPLALGFSFLVCSALLRIFNTDRSEVEEGMEPTLLYRSLWLVGGLSLFLFVSAFYVRPVKHDYETVELSFQKLLSYLESLPPEVLIAGGPCLVDDVPILAKRSVLWNCEQPGEQQTVIDTLNAYYAESMVDVLEFCQQYDIDHFVVYEQSFELDRIREGSFIFEPYTSLLRPQIINRTFFVLQNIPEPMQEYEGDDIIVMPCKPSSIHTDIEGFKLLWSQLNPGKVTTNYNLDIAIGWASNSPLMTKQNLCLEILDSEGHAVQRQCNPLTSDTSSFDSRLDRYYYENYVLHLNPYLDGGTYTIVAEILPLDDGTNPGQEFKIGEFELDTAWREFASYEELEAGDWEISWDNKIALMDYTINESADDSLEMSLRWLTLQRMSNSYKVFAHLVNPKTGELVYQSDTIPRDWTYPTTRWEKNEVITHTLTLPMSDVGSGQYQLWIGLYDAETLERLPLDQAIISENPNYVDAFKLSDLER